MPVLSSVYSLEHSGNLAVDLLRRDPSGLAARLAAGAVAIARGSSEQLVPDVDPHDLGEPDPDLDAARQRALAGSRDVSLIQLSAREMQDLSDEQKLTATLGGAVEIWQTVRDFGAGSRRAREVTAMADAVLALWAGDSIDIEDFVLLTAPAAMYVRITRRGPLVHRAHLGAGTERLCSLVANIASMTADDFAALDTGRSLGQRWEAAYGEAVMDTVRRGPDALRDLALANLSALGALGDASRRLDLNRADEMVAAANLVGAVVAAIAADALSNEDYQLLTAGWL